MTTSGWQSSYAPTVSAAPTAGTGYPPSAQSGYSSAHQTGYTATTQGGYPSVTQAGYRQNAFQQSGYGQQQQDYYGAGSYPQQASPPQIRNPFPLPGQAPAGGAAAAASYDPDYEAQIAQWQSAYTNQEDTAAKGRGANATTLGARRNSNDYSAVATPHAGVEPEKKLTVVRSGGGKKWQDDSLLEWDPTHPRLFVGNLAGEVVDTALFNAFAKYPSLSKARVVRDKQTTKSRGYGFVSFKDTDDFFKAAKEMQGKYIGSHPVQIKRAKTEIKASAPPKKGGKNGAGKQGGGAVGKGADAGVKKKEKKEQGGMKLLG